MEEKKIGDIFKIGDSQFICNESLDGSCDEYNPQNEAYRFSKTKRIHF